MACRGVHANENTKRLEPATSCSSCAAAAHSCVEACCARAAHSSNARVRAGRTSVFQGTSLAALTFMRGEAARAAVVALDS